MWPELDKDVKNETGPNVIQGFPVGTLAKERKEDSKFASVPQGFAQHTVNVNATLGCISPSTNNR